MGRALRSHCRLFVVRKTRFLVPCSLFGQSSEDEEVELEDESDDADDESDEVAEVDDAGAGDDSLDDVFDGPLYRSDSQPPPLRMNPGPSKEIILRALDFPHFGHFLSGFSVIRCSLSNSCPQASHL